MKIIFHIPYPLDFSIAGGGIRPRRMLEAFKALGCEVAVVAGYYDERRQAVKALKRRIEGGETFDFLYSESSSMPTLLTERNHRPRFPLIDFSLFRAARKQGIPVGLFYRDIYWKFALYERNIGWLKSRIGRLFYRVDLYFYRRVLDRLFLPSLEMKGYVSELSGLPCQELPPGHDRLAISYEPVGSGLEVEFLYVGGVTPPVYDLSPLFRLAALGKVDLVCREDEWRRNSLFYEGDRVNLYHLRPDQLESIYRRSHVFALLWKADEYLTFANPLKLYETIGYGMPILTTAGTKVAQVVAENDIGWVVQEDLSDLSLERIRGEYEAKAANLRRIREKHSWTARAQTVIEALSPQGTSIEAGEDA